MTEATQQQLTLNILLVQARDAVVSYYRPVLNQAGVLFVCCRNMAHWIFKKYRNRHLFCVQV